MSKILQNLIFDLKLAANPQKAKILQRFFKTGLGQYGEGDVFWGITVPQQRTIAKNYWRGITLADVDKLLHSKIHEHRLVALLVLVEKYQKTNLAFGRSRKAKLASGSGQTRTIKQTEIFNFYLAHIKYINNWDLVDLSAPKIVGAYLRDKNKKILYKLAWSKNLWERRIAILATFDFIYRGQFKETLKIARLLMKDKHNLIHKATGWMLRETGKRCGEKTLCAFLDNHYKIMPRTMLRYAIERLPLKKKRYYLQS